MIRIRSRFWRRPRYQAYTLHAARDRRRKILELFLILVCLASLNIGAMVWFEGLNPWDALWLTMTTMTTVGYGDMSAATVPGRLATILLMYVFGIFLLAQIAGEWIDYRMDRRERMRLGLWRWQMKNHILIVNTPETDGIRYLQGLVQQIRLSTSLEDYPIQIFSPNFPDGLPAELSSMGVVLHKGQPEGEDDMEAADADKADFIIVMAVDNHDVRSDSVTLDVLDRLSRLDLQGHVIAECVHDHNRERFRRHGANAVIRPVRAYPELMVRAMAAPGTETILEDLFTHDGAHPRRYNLEVPEQSWGELAARLIMANLGTPMGYIGDGGEIVTNPAASRLVKGQSLFLMVSHDAIPSQEAVASVVSNCD